MTYRDFLDQFVDMEGAIQVEDALNQTGFLYVFEVNVEPIGDMKRAVLTEVGDDYVIVSFEEGYMQSFPHALFSIKFDEDDLEEEGEDKEGEEEGER